MKEAAVCIEHPPFPACQTLSELGFPDPPQGAALSHGCFSEQLWMLFSHSSLSHSWTSCLCATVGSSKMGLCRIDVCISSPRPLDISRPMVSTQSKTSPLSGKKTRITTENSPQSDHIINTRPYFSITTYPWSHIYRSKCASESTYGKNTFFQSDSNLSLNFEV